MPYIQCQVWVLYSLEASSVALNKISVLSKVNESQGLLSSPKELKRKFKINF